MDVSSSSSIFDYVDVVEETLSVEKITSLASSPTSGAVAVFVGMTRNHFNGKEVLYLEYESYDAMAKKKLHEICRTVRGRYGVERIVIVHRVGVVKVGESSIVMAISSPHRKAALEAVQYAVDIVKSTVPLWKKEVYSDGTTSWKENQECVWSTSNQ